MKRQGIILTIFATGTLLLSGCSNNAQTGAVIGSLAGAAIGHASGNKGYYGNRRNRDREIFTGAAIGGIIGGAIGNQQDKQNAANRAYAKTTPYYSGQKQTSNTAVNHSHGNRGHSHPGGAGQHAHNGGPTSNASQHSHNTTQREVVYVERPYYPVSTSVIIGSGYHYYPRRHYRYKRHYNNRHRYRHNNRHNHRVRHYNRHKKRY